MSALPSGLTLYTAVAVAALVVALAWILIYDTVAGRARVRRRKRGRRRQERLTREQEQLLRQHSGALAALAVLNQQFAQRLTYPPPIRYEWFEWVDSKVKFDRYDLKVLFLDCLAAHEDDLRRAVDEGLGAMREFAAYRSKVWNIESSCAGRLIVPGIDSQTSAAIERRLLEKDRLPEPALAEVRTYVRYTSPQGRKAYEREAEWTFQQIRGGLVELGQHRGLKESAEYQRQRERSKMTEALRYQVLKRDNFRCQACGATAASGAVLHVDHVLAIANGGRTELSNLQVLCQGCNLGKSHRH